MVYCKCTTKPVVIFGVCHVCKREPAPHETRDAITEITRPGIGFGVEIVTDPNLGYRDLVLV